MGGKTVKEGRGGGGGVFNYTQQHKKQSALLKYVVTPLKIRKPTWRLNTTKPCDSTSAQTPSDTCGLCTSTVMRRLTTGIRSEKYVFRRFRHCANVLEFAYINLDNISYYTPTLRGVARLQTSTACYCTEYCRHL